MVRYSRGKIITMNNHDVNQLNTPVPATKDDLDKFTKDTHRILIGVIIVLFVGFASILIVGIGFIIDSYTFKGETYQNLVNQVNAQNTQISNLNTQITTLTNYIYAKVK